jgi:putative addiction module component (TIGR02574 family)
MAGTPYAEDAMSEAAEKLKMLLAALPREDRAELVEYLTDLNNGDEGEELTPEEWEAHWVEEINRRIEDSKAGKTVGIPHEEVMRQMKEKYG